MTDQPKVVPFRTLAREVSRFKRQGRRIGLVHSSFDQDSGVDRRFLSALGSSSEVVVATVPADSALKEQTAAFKEQGAALKGQGAAVADQRISRTRAAQRQQNPAQRPHLPAPAANGARHKRASELSRLQHALALGELDYVALVPWAAGDQIIGRLKPDVYGYPAADGAPSPAELDALGSVGGELFTLRRRGDALIESRQRVAPATRQRSRFLRELRRTCTASHVLDYIEQLRGLRVAVIGETIIDEYAYCDALGKSGKEPMLVTRFQSCEAQAGGVLAIANHLAQFCDEVEVVSALGEIDRREDFVRSALHPRIHPTFCTKSGSPTIVKRRYLDAYSLAKMMGVYHMNPSDLTLEDEAKFAGPVAAAAERSDVVVVADYGHGLITSDTIETLAASSTFLAVNTQLNAANTGYHTISKYPRADFACLHEGELRLDARDLRSELAEVTRRTARRLQAQHVLVTLGKKGTMLTTREGQSYSCPALATTVLERIGAGDAVLALTSVVSALGMPPQWVGFVGNLAGAQAVSVIGNSASIQKSLLVESIRRMLPDAPAAAGVGQVPDRLRSE